MDEIELHTVPGVTSFDDYPVERYLDWEREVAQPALETAGWTVGPFRTLEGDETLGPMIRGVICTKGDLRTRFWYG